MGWKPPVAPAPTVGPGAVPESHSVEVPKHPLGTASTATEADNAGTTLVAGYP